MPNSPNKVRKFQFTWLINTVGCLCIQEYRT